MDFKLMLSGPRYDGRDPQSSREQTKDDGSSTSR